MPIDGAAPPRADESPRRFLGIDFDPLDLPEMLDWMARQRGRAGFRFVVTPNVDHVVKLFPRRPGPVTPTYRAAYAKAALRLCDSRILQRLASMRGIDLPLCPGSTLTATMMERLLRAGDTVAIVGGSAASLAILRERYPLPRFIQHIPPMGVLGKPDAIAAIGAFLREADADFVLLCIGSPQSEIIAARLLEAGDVRGTALCVGASIAFVTGEVRRAPAWMQRAGIEWLHRLLAEPRRMWRRYLIEDPRVFWLALADWAGHGPR